MGQRKSGAHWRPGHTTLRAETLHQQATHFRRSTRQRGNDAFEDVQHFVSGYIAPDAAMSE